MSEPDHQLDLLHERNALHHALLSSSPEMAAEEDIHCILSIACDLLLRSSPSIQAAWSHFGPLTDNTFKVDYCCGSCSPLSSIIEMASDVLTNPVREAVQSGRPSFGLIPTQDEHSYHQAMLKAGLYSFAALPFGYDKETDSHGIIFIYSDNADYFSDIGDEPFLSFSQLGKVIVEKACQHAHLHELATFDHLTRLFNRRALQEILENEHAAAIRHKRNYSILLLDMDHFKLINDNYGHHTGDQVLIAASSLAKDALRDCDWLGRWGGEEFLCLLPDTDSSEAAHIAERIRERIANCPSLARQTDIHATVSIGLASYPEAGKALEAIIASADGALYEAKRSGRNRVIVGNKELELFALAGEIEAAIREKRIVTAYQTIIDTKTGETFALEALARIKKGDNLIEAREFARAASQLQLMHQIDHVVLQQTLSQILTNSSGKAIPFFMNVSADLLRQQHLLNQLYNHVSTLITEETKLPPIIIEITERELLNSPDDVIKTLQPFLDLGAKLAIDDFGSGYSSFRYLADLPVDFLKIEGNLIQRSISEPRVKTILQGIQDIACQLKLKTVAEHVEDAETLLMIKEIGIDLAQGYHLGMPTLTLPKID